MPITRFSVKLVLFLSCFLLIVSIACFSQSPISNRFVIISAPAVLSDKIGHWNNDITGIQTRIELFKYLDKEIQINIAVQIFCKEIAEDSVDYFSYWSDGRPVQKSRYRTLAGGRAGDEMIIRNQAQFHTFLSDSICIIDSLQLWIDMTESRLYCTDFQYCILNQADDITCVDMSTSQPGSYIISKRVFLQPGAWNHLKIQCKSAQNKEISTHAVRFFTSDEKYMLRMAAWDMKLHGGLKADDYFTEAYDFALQNIGFIDRKNFWEFLKANYLL